MELQEHALRCLLPATRFSIKNFTINNTQRQILLGVLPWLLLLPMRSPGRVSPGRETPRLTPRLRPVSEKDDPEGDRYNNPFAKLVLILLAAGVLWGIYHLYSGDPASPTVINEDGEEVLSPERQGKLDRELEEIDHAVQYVLIASSDGYYPCYTCPDSLTTIFLSKFEVWRYGATRRGEARRYPNGNYRAPNLLYVEEFTGTYSECLKREKIQIYKYPLLPQARQRKIILFRSPGNKNDG